VNQNLVTALTGATYRGKTSRHFNGKFLFSENVLNFLEESTVFPFSKNVLNFLEESTSFGLLTIFSEVSILSRMD